MNTNTIIEEKIKEAELRNVLDRDPNGFRKQWLRQSFQEVAEKAREENSMIKTLLEQIIEMNGEEWFWKRMNQMPVTKFNTPLKKLLSNPTEQ